MNLATERWADKKAGRVYGGNDGLAFAMCEALQKRKNRQGGQKLFFVLIFWLLFYQEKSDWSAHGNRKNATAPASVDNFGGPRRGRYARVWNGRR
jgi:hypothetical protein